MKKNNILLILVLLSLYSCKKHISEEEADRITCTNIKNGKLFSNGPVTLGQTIHFGFPEVGGYRIYTWHGPNNYTGQEPSDSIVGAELKHEGWYYLHLANPTCDAKTDSIYVDVKLQQGTPSCSVSNNVTTYSSLANDNYTAVSKGIEPTYSLFALDASGPSSNMKVYFHHYWRTHEPEDGIYTTTNTPLFDQFDYNYNKVFVTTTKNSIYWSSNDSKLVYVSHVGGKLQVKFCSLPMGGYNGISYTTIASGNILEK